VKRYTMNLQDWGAWFAIVAGGIAVIAAIIACYRFIKHKIIFRHPVNATYLVPRAEYPYCKFDGAPVTERKPKKLTIGIGKYRLINILNTEANVKAEHFILTFEGPDLNKPSIDEPDNPFTVGTIEKSGIRYSKDWWGYLHPYSTEISTSYWLTGQTRILGHKITTCGEWEGKTCISIPIIGEKPYTIALDLKVSVEHDEIPFLKIE